MACPPPDYPKSNDSKSAGNDDAVDPTRPIEGDPASLMNELKKAKEQEACFIVIRGQPQGERLSITQNEMVIGRDHQAEIHLDDPGISKKHARVQKVKNEVLLTDLGSTNGTSVNDKRIPPNSPRVLAKEDMIKIGQTILKFLPAGQLEILFYGNLGSAAHTDALTRIYNRRYLDERLDAEFKRAKALHTDLALLYFDLDHFKKINDTHGHDVGDFVLEEFAQLIRSSYIRPKDVFARFGGEEFVILLNNMNAQAATELAEKIRAAVEFHAFIHSGKRIPVTVSLGVAELRSDMESPQMLIKTADKALYEAKMGGRNRVITAN